MRSTNSFLFLTSLVGLTFVGTAGAQMPPTPKVVRWEKDATTAYNKAIQEKKALVIVYVCPLVQDKCVHCKRFRGSLFSDEFNSLAGRAVFVLCELDVRTVYKSASAEREQKESKGWDRTDTPKEVKPVDEAGAVLFKRLQGKQAPMVSILEPNPAVVVEIARLNGYFDAKGLSGHVEQIVTRWIENGSKITPPLQPQK